MKKKILLSGFSVFITLFWVVVLFLFVERYFFDRVFYKKSIFHGYGDHIWSFPQKNFGLDSVRAKDLLWLFSDESQSESEIPLPAHVDEELTIAILGDSMAAGVGVRIGESYPYQLERFLRKESHGKWQKIKVYNFSRAGDHILDHWFKYQEIERKKIPIDLYIFDMVNNDLLFDYHGKYASNSAYFLLKEQCREYEEVKVEEGKSVYDSELANSFQPSYANMCIAKKVIRQLDSSDSIVFLSWASFIPLEKIPLEVPALLSWDQGMQLYASLLLSEDKEVWSPYDSGFLYDEVSAAEGHPSKRAHKQLAEIMGKKVLDFLKE